MQDTIIISLGGSLIVPDAIDEGFLREFRDLILAQTKLGKKFVITTGGGKVCRRYQEAAAEISGASDVDKDWIGIASLKLNAELVRVVFGEHAYENVVFNLSEKPETEKPIIIGAAYEPGHSTDWDMVLAAKTFGAKKAVNLSNVDYVYDSDPRNNPDAKKFESISWSEYRKLIPEDWNPGLSTPFDPIAAKEAESSGIEVSIMNGKPLDNFAEYLRGGKFKGTVIK